MSNISSNQITLAISNLIKDKYRLDSSTSTLLVMMIGYIVTFIMSLNSESTFIKTIIDFEISYTIIYKFIIICICIIIYIKYKSYILYYFKRYESSFCIHDGYLIYGNVTSYFEHYKSFYNC